MHFVDILVLYLTRDLNLICHNSSTFKFIEIKACTAQSKEALADE